MQPLRGDPFALLAHEAPRLLFFGGKGGVGKTTVAAAFSLYCSDRYPQKRVLVVSTDPAHSLSDSFDEPLGAVPGPVYRRANLFGLELDATTLFARFREDNSLALKKIVERGTALDEEDLARLLDLSFPGLDEVMALLQILDLMERADYDLMIVDTAPTGHTLRLLELPVLMQGWTAFLDTLMAKHRYMARLYTRTYRPDEADAFINTLTRDITRIRRVLQNKRWCRFVSITLLESVVLSETQRLLTSLTRMGIAVKEVLINQIIIDPAACERCRARARVQHVHLNTVRKEWPTLRTILLPASPQEVRGEERLRAFADGALALTDVLGGSRTTPSVPIPRPTCASTTERQNAVPLRMPAPEPSLQLVLFCGKGGVGKTTLSSAWAFQLSRHFPKKNILLFSTDPAHSLSDCLGQNIGHHDTRVNSSENLFASEIDPTSLFSAWKQSYAHQIEEAFEGVRQRTGLEIQFDRDVLTGLLDLAPPGLDEIMALTELADDVEEERYDLYVLDLAPTGHALRFLELPDLVQDWLRAFFEIVLKYRRVIRLPRASDLLIELSKKVKKIQQLFSDPARCDCIAVTIPTEVALRETRRLISDVRRLKIPLRRLVVNRVAPPWTGGGCGYCDGLAQEHERMCHRFREAFPDLDIMRLPQVPHELKGVKALTSVIRFHE